MTTANPLFRRIREAIDHRRCVPVFGAGVSVAANAPTWAGYLEQIARGLDLRPDQLRHLDPVDAASYLHAERGRLGLPPVKVMIAGPTRAHRALAAWGCPVYATTNFDDGMERALGSVGAFEVCHNDQLADLHLSLRTNPVVVKLCSSSASPNPGATTRDEFARLLHHDSAALELLVTLLRCYTVVFVGCSLRDPLISRALDHAFAIPIGRERHVAILPDDVPDAYRAVLARMGVDALVFPSNDKTKHLADTLEECKRTASGQKRLVVFEPGTQTKARQIIAAIQAGSLDIGRVAIVTETSAIAETARRLAASELPQVKVDVLHLANLVDTQSVLRALADCTTSWNAIVAPYEYAVANAAELARAWTAAHVEMRFHGVETAQTSRDKRRFRAHLAAYPGLKYLVPIENKTIRVETDMSAGQLLEAIRLAARELGTSGVVVKPPDAAGSVGVRPFDLTNESAAQAAVTDLLNILQSMPVTDATARCEISELVVDRRIESEEFSVESRRVMGVIEPLAVHWKVDIDADPTRFFERLFVTVPRDLPISQRLVAANQELLHAVGVNDGVFHAEYRADPDGSGVHALEVGLRPGGGMVSASVQASRGVELFEAAIRCALDAQKNETRREHIVATGLVFAKQPGVLPPLGVLDGESIRYLNHDDPSSLSEWLRQYLARIDRTQARQALEQIMTRPNALCRDVRMAFDDAANNGKGLRVELRRVDLWEKPGSIVTEEEACYVAGLLVAADSTLSPLAAVAESVAAMQLCLRAFVCEPREVLSAIRWRSTRIRDYPKWWTELSTGGFRSDIDSWTFSRAVEQHREHGPSILDLGCGSARPAIRALKAAGRYHGVDISAEAIKVARGNLAREISDHSRWHVERQDVMASEWVDALCDRQWDLVAANLPYLPAPPGAFVGDEARQVDGGPRGLAFLPRVLEIAGRIRPRAVVVSTSSLCDLAGVGRLLDEARLGVHRVVAVVAPLESYARKVRNYLRAGEFSRIFGAESDERQVIYAVELREGSGIPFRLMTEQADAVLRPDLNQVGTMAVGAASW